MLEFLGPFSLIVYFIIGIVIGVTIFPSRWLKFNGWLQTAGIALTLFSMGASMAGSPTFLGDLKVAGVQAVLFAGATITGSVFVVWALTKIVFPKKCAEEREE